MLQVGHIRPPVEELDADVVEPEVVVVEELVALDVDATVVVVATDVVPAPPLEEAPLPVLTWPPESQEMMPTRQRARAKWVARIRLPRRV